MEARLKGEGLEFELEFPDENTVVLRAGGREFNFTKLEKYDVKNAKGEVYKKPMEEVIESEIRSIVG